MPDTPAGPPAPGPALPHEDDHAPTIARNARVGLVLFAVYVVLYGGFMLLSAFAPTRMSEPVVAGVNLAVVYGFGLIVAALVLALVYMALVRPMARDREGGVPGGATAAEGRR